MKRVCVFCGSSNGVNPLYLEAAREVGRTLVRRGLGLVYGGGSVGLMGAVADAAMAAGGEVIGVIPRALQLRELAHGFVALPGGMGTLEEFAEVLTWAQLGLHARPCGLLDVGGYYRPLVAFFDRAVAQGFIRPEHRGLVLMEERPDALLDRFEAWQPPPIQKWIDKGSA